MSATTGVMRLYSPSDEVLGDLWQYDDFTLTRSRKPDPDAASMTVRRGTPSADLLESDWLFARPVVNGDVKPWVFVLSETEEDDRHPDRDVRPIRASFVGIESWLDQALVYPENLPSTATGALTQDTSTDGNPLVLGHRFADTNAGGIIKTLIDRAKARGALTRITTDFNDSTDSNSVSWVADDEMDETYTVGVSVKSVLDSLAGINWCAYRFDDFTLRLFRPDTLGADRPGVVMQALGYITAAPRRKRRLDAKATMLVLGEQQALFERVDTVARAALGRREGFYNRGGVYQLATITRLAQLALDSQKNITESLTLSIVSDACPYTPGVDYDLWDRIYYDGIPGEPLRVNTITQRWTAQGEVTTELELLDRLADQADRLSKLLQRIQQPDAPDARLPDRIDPIPTIPPSSGSLGDQWWNDFNNVYQDWVANQWDGDVGGGFGGIGMGWVYVQPNEPPGVPVGTLWFDTDDFSV